MGDLSAKDATIRMTSEVVRTDPNLSGKDALLALVDESRIRAGIARKEFAINAGIQESVLSEALNGTRGNFAIHWLANQPKDFWAAFIKIVSVRFDINEEAQADLDAARIGELVGLLIKTTRRDL